MALPKITAAPTNVQTSGCWLNRKKPSSVFHISDRKPIGWSKVMSASW